MDREEAAVIFRTYSKKLFNIALRITASVPEAEEIMQESIIRYLIKAPRLDAEPMKAAWLRSTCVRLSIDWLRRTRRLQPLDSGTESIPDESGSPEDSMWGNMGKDTVAEVMSALESLPCGYRTVLVLRLIENYDYGMIAGLMHISENGVRSQYLRARRKLAGILKDRFGK